MSTSVLECPHLRAMSVSQLLAVCYIQTFTFQYIPKGARIMLQSENGLLGMVGILIPLMSHSLVQGPYPKPGKQHPDFINAGVNNSVPDPLFLFAGKETITTVPG